MENIGNQTLDEIERSLLDSLRLILPIGRLVVGSIMCSYFTCPHLGGSFARSTGCSRKKEMIHRYTFHSRRSDVLFSETGLMLPTRIHAFLQSHHSRCMRSLGSVRNH